MERHQQQQNDTPNNNNNQDNAVVVGNKHCMDLYGSHQQFPLRHVLLVPTTVPVPVWKQQDEQQEQAILVLVQQHVIHNHTKIAAMTNNSFIFGLWL